MVEPVSLLSLATAVPPNGIDQPVVERLARQVYADVFERFPAMAEVFANTGIERRYLVQPHEWYLTPRDFGERMEVYLDAAGSLFLDTARRALMRAGMAARDVDVVVTVSSTGIATPSLEARVMHELGLREDVLRVPVFGLGCAGGVSGLAIASRLARAVPGQTVLMVTVELCSLALRIDRDAIADIKRDIVATALFGDGAAAAVLRAEGPSVNGVHSTLGAAYQHTWPDTLDIMGWSVDPLGFGVVLSRSLPEFIEERLAAPLHRFLRASGLDNARPRIVCHPGGTRVMTAVERTLQVAEGTLTEERDVLRDYGNMSAPTVLFVLQRALKNGLKGPAILSALGPGFTATFLALETPS